MPSDFPLRHLRDQAAAFRDAVARIGSDGTVPTCPGWDALKLLRHLSRVYGMALAAVRLAPEDQLPEIPTAPKEFTEALSYFDDRLAELNERLSIVDDARPVWSYVGPVSASWWARRVAHETAIHRLDAEHALAEVDPEHTDDLLFDPEFAADGIDEMLTELYPGTRAWSEEHHTGRVLYHAADAGRTWLVTYHDGQPPEIGVPSDAALGRDEVDSTVAGTADAVYRAVWGRPSHALVQGDAELGALVRGVG